MKFVPATVSVNALDPAGVEVGAMLDSTGTGLPIVNVAGPEDPPPGVGFTTVTLAAPALTISAAVIAAVNCVELTYVVARLAPFHCTALAATEPVDRKSTR